ncbi:MAG: DUF423 domain-containing protein [Nitrospirota bacterium]
MTRAFLPAGAVMAGLSVAAGAFGAHSLKAVLSPEQMTVFETAARYQMYHALGLVAVGVLGQAGCGGDRLIRAAGWLFFLGILLFSGSLYLVTLTGIRWLGAVTPLGGAAFLAGWGTLAWAAIKSKV